jgi:hypothetical protein
MVSNAHNAKQIKGLSFSPTPSLSSTIAKKLATSLSNTLKTRSIFKQHWKYTTSFVILHTGLIIDERRTTLLKVLRPNDVSG